MSSSGVRKGKPESTRFEPQQSSNFQNLNPQNMLNNSPKPLIIAIKVIKLGGPRIEIQSMSVEAAYAYYFVITHGCQY